MDFQRAEWKMWLVVCKVGNALFCYPCILFHTNSSIDTAWTTTGVMDKQKAWNTEDAYGHLPEMLCYILARSVKFCGASVFSTKPIYPTYHVSRWLDSLQQCIIFYNIIPVYSPAVHCELCISENQPHFELCKGEFFSFSKMVFIEFL